MRSGPGPANMTVEIPTALELAIRPYTFVIATGSCGRSGYSGRQPGGRGNAWPLGSMKVTVCSRELERVVLFRGQIGLGDRQAGRVNRNDAVLFRDGWDACPGCDDENATTAMPNRMRMGGLL
jgi:hypothetical protein